MDDSKRTRLHMNPIDEPRPQPIFANHIVTRGMGDYVALNFYSGLLTQALAPDEEIPSETKVDAHIVAQIVVPTERWRNFITNVVTRTEQAEGKEG